MAHGNREDVNYGILCCIFCLVYGNIAATHGKQAQQGVE